MLVGQLAHDSALMLIARKQVGGGTPALSGQFAPPLPACFQRPFRRFLGGNRHSVTSLGRAHTPPLRLEFADGPHWAETQAYPMVGAMPDMTPATITVQIMPGTPHFMYTASPSEAMNANEDLYGRIRLTKTHTSLAGEYTPPDRRRRGICTRVVREATHSEDMIRLAVHHVAPAQQGKRFEMLFQEDTWTSHALFPTIELW